MFLLEVSLMLLDEDGPPSPALCTSVRIMKGPMLEQNSSYHLMCAAYQVHVVLAKKTGHHVRPENEGDSAIVLSPSWEQITIVPLPSTNLFEDMIRSTT